MQVMCLYICEHQNMAFTILQLTALVLGILLFFALIYIFHNWLNNRNSEKVTISLNEVVVDGRKGDGADHGKEEIFDVSTRFKEIVLEDRNNNRPLQVTAEEENRKISNHTECTHL